MKRKIIRIDEEKCNGCGDCIPNCPEGALQIVDGKARLVRDLLCDGLGACIGHCPLGAITIEERNAEAYDERAAIRNVMEAGHETIQAHLQHLREHGDQDNLKIALSVLQERKGIAAQSKHTHSHSFSGCPGSRSMEFTRNGARTAPGESAPSQQASELTHWPIQLHLMSSSAPHYRRKDVLLAADCVAFSLGGFHRDFLRGKALAIACPKLDEGQEIYVEKIKALIDQAEINTLTVITMVVPCCTGLLHLAQEAAKQASRKIPIKHVTVGLEGTILNEKWI